MLLEAPGTASGVRVSGWNILENGGGVVGGLCVNDRSSLGNTPAGVSSCGGTGVVGVIGGVGTMIVDETERVRCLPEIGCGDSKFAVEIESKVDAELRLSNFWVWRHSSSDSRFMRVAWNSAWGGSEPKTCNTK